MFFVIPQSRNNARISGFNCLRSFRLRDVLRLFTRGQQVYIWRSKWYATGIQTRNKLEIKCRHYNDLKLTFGLYPNNLVEFWFSLNGKSPIYLGIKFVGISFTYYLNIIICTYLKYELIKVKTVYAKELLYLIYIYGTKRFFP